jgi:hypothetical protein
MFVKVGLVVFVMTLSVFSLALANAYDYAYIYTNKLEDAVLSGQFAFASLALFFVAIGFAIAGIITSRKK